MGSSLAFMGISQPGTTGIFYSFPKRLFHARILLFTLGLNSVVLLLLSGTSVAQSAMMSSPAPGSTLSGSSATFNWTLATGVTNAGLWVGTTAGGSDLYMGSPTAGPITTTTVSGLPVNGSTVYVTLWYQIGGSWQYIDYTYKAAGTPTAMTSPTPGSVLPGASVTFNWTLVTGATNAGLWVGTTAGSNDIYLGSPTAGPITTSTVSGLPVNGSTVYVRLWAQVSGNWQYIDYTYTAF
jgi:hypothetical protein